MNRTGAVPLGFPEWTAAPPAAAPRVQLLVRALILFVAYSATAMLGLSLHSFAGFATLIWPPTGIALVALLVWGRSIWPVITLAAFVVNVLSDAPPGLALVIAGGNTLEALSGRWVLERTGFDSKLTRVRDVLRLVVLAAGLSAAVSATIGVAGLWGAAVIDASQLWTAWSVWWLGDALGCLVVAPLLLVWHAHPKVQLSRAKALELAALVLAHALALYVIFTPGQEHPLGRLYLLYPVLIWAALRFGQRAVATLIFLVAAGSLSATLSGIGPFAQPSLGESLFPQQGFTAITAIAVLILAAAISERNNAIKVSTANAKASKFLADAGAVLSSSLDYEQTLQSLARLVVPALADYCVIDVVDGTGFRRVAEASGDPSKEELIRGLRRFPFDKDRNRGLVEVLEAGRSVVLPRLEEEELKRFALDPAQLEILRQLGLLSSVISPIRAGARLLGVVIFGTAGSGRNYEPPDLRLAEELGVRAGLAIENARLYAEARQAVELRDEFLGVAAHELRTPLTALELQVGLLSRLGARAEAIPSQAFGPRVHALSRQLGRFSSLIDNLLDVTRLTSGQLSFEFEEVELVELAREVALRFHDQAARAGSKLSFVSEPTAVTGQWDRLRLEQILTNLLSNAVKYGSGGPIVVRIAADEQRAILSVIDRGVGIESQDHARIFQRFERATSPKSFGGLGLGLWIVEKLVTGMGATITVDSRPGEGSTFTVTLPRSR